MINKKTITGTTKSAIVWTTISLAILVFWYAAVVRKMDQNVHDLTIVIKTATDQRALISKKEVSELFRSYIGYDVRKAKIAQLDIMGLENLLVNDKRVKRAEVYVDKHFDVNVYILQREPILRVMQSDQSYYLDSEGVKIPSYRGRAIRTLIATGDIAGASIDIGSQKKIKHIDRVLSVAKVIDKDDFLEALVEQIDIDSEGMVTLVPKMGDQVLEMNDARNIDEQMNRLKIFYRNGIHNVGWKRHSAFRLDVKGQVIGKRIES